MADIICTRCGEPWDAVHVRNEAFEGDEYDGRENMPADVAEAYDGWVDARRNGTRADAERAFDRLGLAYYDTGLGSGCTSCWYDPSRVRSDDERMAILEDAIHGPWDGDPLELIDRFF